MAGRADRGGKSVSWTTRSTSLIFRAAAGWDLLSFACDHRGGKSLSLTSLAVGGFRAASALANDAETGVRLASTLALAGSGVSMLRTDLLSDLSDASLFAM